jgi:hypothetical protein
LPVPLREVDPDFLEIFFNFANTFTEESVLQGYAEKAKEAGSGPSADIMRRMGYTEAEIANMDLRDGNQE